MCLNIGVLDFGEYEKRGATNRSASGRSPTQRVESPLATYRLQDGDIAANPGVSGALVLAVPGVVGFFLPPYAMKSVSARALVGGVIGAQKAASGTDRLFL